MNESLISIFKYLPFIKLAIYLMIIVSIILIIFRLFNIRSFGVAKGVSSSLKQSTYMRNRDAYIVKTNTLLRHLSRIAQHSPFGIDETSRDYLQYNINRIGLKAPGGARMLTAEEFNAVKLASTAVGLALSLVVTVFTNLFMGCLIAVISIVCFYIMPLPIIRNNVKKKDKEIEDNFMGVYLVLHYLLMEGAKGSISKAMRSFSKATKSEEIKKFIHVAAGYMESYGEEEALFRIKSDYREINYVVKLTRLIKQLYDGAEIKNDLMGFRGELIRAAEREMEKKTDRLITLAQGSFKILWLVLIQAVISALSIYMPDINVLFNMI